MADAFVSFAVQKLGDFLIQQVNLLTSLRDEVRWLRNELLFMQSFLKDAEQKQSRDQRVQQWVFEINSIANDAVAILETYSFEVGKGASRLKACACICRKETKFYKVAKEIQSLKERIQDISRKRETYGITNIDNNAGEGPSNRTNNQSPLRRTTSYVDDQDYIFVGLQDVVQTLLDELLKAESRRNVVSIYGMGGLGKTTLARNLYKSPTIVSSFPICAWICVSQEYNTMDLLKNIIKSIKGCAKETLDLLERMTERDLEIYLRDLLKEDKYLVVVDDVWQREAWESLKRAFPDSKNGSRVIITTRKEDVAERADNRGFVHKLRFLSKEESWDLFCRKLLDVRAMVPKMERVAKDMVDKCGGLPLAIVVLSGLLSHKGGLDEWQKVKDHLWKNIEKDSIEISYLLSLSYNDLSTALKQCFLYFGIFPEDEEVYAENIIWLWMAEGFIPRGEERMEDVAEGFLNELIRRSLIQVVDTFWEKVIECRVHDLLRDLAIQKALEVNFFDIYDPIKHSISSLCIRHAIHSQGERYLSLDLSNLKLRSIMLFDPDFRNMSRIKFGNVFQYIYVLYLDVEGGIIPDAIGSLYHLKFLKTTGISGDLPSSIGNLKNLQTLYVDGFSCQLPQETADLINLRHLVAPYLKPLKRISKLTCLQVLKDICCDQWKDVDPVDLVNLGELGMIGIEKSYSLNNISSLKNLSTLRLLCESSDESFSDLEFLNFCQKLQKLCLKGRIEKLPLFPNSITMMVLEGSKLMEDPMPILGMLPNLRKIRSDAYSVLYLDIQGGIIPDAIGSLYHLKLLRMTGIRGDLPASIGNLRNLQTLLLYGLSYQLPPETTDLINLRHLVAPYSKPLKRISKLTSLQVLEGVCCDQWKDVDPVDLVNLRELSMINIKKSYSLNNISSLKNLSTLRLFCYNDSFPALEFVNSCEKLQKLRLNGRIKKLPLFPNSITMMVLTDSELMEDPMPILGMLPNLRNLELCRAYEGKEIMCSDNSFSQLEFLHLYKLMNLETWHLATSAMPLIKGLRIYECPNLNEIPDRMKDVKLLKTN